jgi:hypothetical protein
MRKIKEVLRLRFGLGLHQDQIARSCSIGQATVHRYLEKAAAAKLVWPLPDDLDERQLDELLFPARPLPAVPRSRPVVDFAQLHSQLHAHKHLTLQLLWEEYRETHPDGYGYSRFCGYTRDGIAPGMSCSGTTTSQGKRHSSIGPGIQYRSIAAMAARPGRHQSLWPCSAPAPTPLREPPWARVWRTGSIATCRLLSSSVARRSYGELAITSFM